MASASVRTKRLRWSMFWAVVSYFVTTAGTQLTNYLTGLNVTPLQASLISTGVGLVVVLIGVLIDSARDDSGAVEPVPPPRPGAPTPPPRKGRTSLAGAIVLILVLCGGGGLAITYAANWAVDKGIALARNVTGDNKADPGQERLARPATGRNGVLSATVTSVQVNERATVVKVTVKNAGGETATMPSMASQLVVPQSTTLDADPSVGTWRNGEVAAGQERTGTIVFDGRLSANAKTVTLNFTDIFIMGPGEPRNLSVQIPLN